MTRYSRIEASRLARGGRDTTVPVRVDREPGDGVRLAKAALASQRPRTGLRAVMDAEFRAHMRKKLAPSATGAFGVWRYDDSGKRELVSRHATHHEASAMAGRMRDGQSEASVERGENYLAGKI